MNDLWRGAIGGLAGTLVMSAAMAASRLAGTMRGEVPPRKITRHLAHAAGVRGDLSQPTFEASWVVQHLAYGTAAGVAYALADRRLDLPPPAVAGPLFGASLWAFSYAGWLPVAGLDPPPDRDRSSRLANMIVHHLIYGTTTALVARALRPRPLDWQI
jgi:uncharacterized membrane protein YagU involved in acid resistance